MKYRCNGTMATTTFSLEELLAILIANGLLPAQRIARARVKGDAVHFVVKTGSFVLPYVPASLRFVSFGGGSAVFELAVLGGRLNKTVSWLNEALKQELPACVRLEFPNVLVDIDKTLAEKNIKGIRVEDIRFEAGRFVIVTSNT